MQYQFDFYKFKTPIRPQFPSWYTYHTCYLVVEVKYGPSLEFLEFPLRPHIHIFTFLSTLTFDFGWSWLRHNLKGYWEQFWKTLADE